MTDTKVCRQRWRLLSQALLNKESSSSSDNVNAASIRRFSSFDLFSVEDLDPNNDQSDSKWYRYSCQELGDVVLYVRILSHRTDVQDLAGFNNTGNVCVWPSEEVMARYCILNASRFDHKSVCEIGGGMTCLASLLVAATSKATMVCLTDGNESSVDNIEAIVERNRAETFGDTEVVSRLLRWSSTPAPEDLRESFDFVLCADCVFFKDTAEYLVKLIHDVLKAEGVAILVAPSRGGTLRDFVGLAETCFATEEIKDHDWLLTQKYAECAKNPMFSEDLHYPRVFELCKRAR